MVHLLHGRRSKIHVGNCVSPLVYITLSKFYSFRLNKRRLPALECHNDSKGADYRGKKSISLNGLKCQDWSAQSPQSHTDFPTDECLSGKDLLVFSTLIWTVAVLMELTYRISHMSTTDIFIADAKNYCRNPGVKATDRGATQWM